MAEKWFNELKDRIESFVLDATDEELEAAFSRADYAFYKNVKEPVLLDWMSNHGR